MYHDPAPSSITRCKRPVQTLLTRWLLGVAGLAMMVQMSWGQGFTEGLNNSVTNVTVSGGAYFTGNSAAADGPATSPLAQRFPATSPVPRLRAINSSSIRALRHRPPSSTVYPAPLGSPREQ